MCLGLGSKNFVVCWVQVMLWAYCEEVRNFNGHVDGSSRAHEQMKWCRRSRSMSQGPREEDQTVDPSDGGA